jgi:hypothetical protein
MANFRALRLQGSRRPSPSGLQNVLIRYRVIVKHCQEVEPVNLLPSIIIIIRYRYVTLIVHTKKGAKLPKEVCVAEEERSELTHEKS